MAAARSTNSFAPASTSRLLAVALAGTLAFALAPSAARAVDVHAVLEARIPEINVENSSLGKVIEFLQHYTGANIAVEWNALDAAGVNKDTPVSVRLTDTTVERILHVVLGDASSTAQLAYAIDGNVLTITTQDAADKKLVTKVINVQDLLMQNDTVKPPRFDLQQATATATGTSTANGGGGGGQQTSIFTGDSNNDTTTKETPDQRAQKLVDLIEASVRPDIWSEKGGPASIKYFDGRLIITAPQVVLDAIGN